MQPAVLQPMREAAMEAAKTFERATCLREPFSIRSSRRGVSTGSTQCFGRCIFEEAQLRDKDAKKDDFVQLNSSLNQKSFCISL